MHIIGIYPEENLNILKKFATMENITPFLERDKIVFTVPSGTCVSDFPRRTEYKIKVSEEGGGKTKVGFAKIVCGLNGEKLKPTEIITYGHLANQIHAYFILDKFYIVTSTKRGMISILHNTTTVQNGFIFLETIVRWKGDIQGLPLLYRDFTDASLAAMGKAGCYHCKEPHYILK